MINILSYQSIISNCLMMPLAWRGLLLSKYTTPGVKSQFVLSFDDFFFTQ